MATTTYGQEPFAHYHVLQTESCRDMPAVDMGYFKLGEARKFVDDMLKRILHRAKTVDTDQTYICIEQVLGDIRKDWTVQVIGISAWRDLLKGYIVPRDAKYGPSNLDNTYYAIKRCRNINCADTLLGQPSKAQAKYLAWYNRMMDDSGDYPLESIDLESIDLDEITEVMPNGINFIEPIESVETGNDLTLGHYY